MEKVVFMSSSFDEEFSLLTIHVSGKLAMFKSADKRWTIIRDMPSPYDDVILFRGEFYAVDGTGRTVLVGLSLDVSLVAESVYGGDKKFLVESNGGLLLVDMYLSAGDVCIGDGDDVDVDEVFDEYVGERAVRFKVFELDIEGKRWEEVENLRDRVLFLGDDCAFSASVAELSLSGCIKGNCVLFTDNFFYSRAEEGSGSDGVFKGRDICLFDLDNGNIALLADCPEYSRLFWPPPDWVAETHLTVSIVLCNNGAFYLFNLVLHGLNCSLVWVFSFAFLCSTVCLRCYILNYQFLVQTMRAIVEDENFHSLVASLYML